MERTLMDDPKWLKWRKCQQASHRLETIYRLLLEAGEPDLAEQVYQLKDAIALVTDER